MSKTVFVVAAVAVALAGIFAYQLVSQPRLTQAQIDATKETLKKLEAAKAETKTPEQPQPAEKAAMEWPEKCPDTFKINFECSNGSFVMQCHKDWAPIGVEHFYNLLKLGFYDNARFFRVVPGFVVQFGMPGDPAMGAKYGEENIKDEPVTKSNTPGMVTYAKTNAPNSRSTQLFINLGNNAQLDRMGFAPFAEILEGMDVVKKINAEYGEQPNQGLIRAQGNAYLEQAFPRLDYVKKITLIP